MKRSIFIFVLILLFTVSSFPQDYMGKARTQGIVLDEEGNPIEGVRIKLTWVKTNSSLEKTTDSKGEWRASWIRGGDWNIDFEKMGYVPKNISTNFTEVGKNPTITITMEKAEEVFISDVLKEDFDKGLTLYDEAKYTEAIEVFQGILDGYPDAYMMNMNIGDCYFKLEDYDQAETYYLKHLEFEPDNHDVIIAIGNCYGNRGDNETALEWYKKIDMDDIKSPVVLYNIGVFFYNSSQFDDAMMYFKKALEIKEDSLDALYQLALAYLALGNRDAALAEFEKYLTFDRDSERADQVRGFIEYLKK
jgi:tetratricopeptide (TPR) repeat protein